MVNKPLISNLLTSPASPCCDRMSKKQPDGDVVFPLSSDQTIQALGTTGEQVRYVRLGCGSIGGPRIHRSKWGEITPRK